MLLHPHTKDSYRSILGIQKSILGGMNPKDLQSSVENFISVSSTILSLCQKCDDIMQALDQSLASNTPIPLIDKLATAAQFADAICDFLKATMPLSVFNRLLGSPSVFDSLEPVRTKPKLMNSESSATSTSQDPQITHSNPKIALEKQIESNSAVRMTILSNCVSQLIFRRFQVSNIQTQTETEDVHSVEYYAKSICETLNVVCAPDQNPLVNIDSVCTKISSMIKENPNLQPKPRVLQPITLNSSQQKRFNLINDTFSNNYSIRRQLFLQRLDVTAQSFTWRSQGKQFEDQIHELIRYHRSKLLANSFPLDFYSCLCAPINILELTPTNSGSNLINTRSSAIKNAIIGAVPDRGGRPDEERMDGSIPEFQKRTKPKAGGRVEGGQRRQHRRNQRRQNRNNKNRKNSGSDPQQGTARHKRPQSDS